MLVGHRDHPRGREAVDHLTRDVRPGQHSHWVAGEQLVDHLGHPQLRPLLEALGEADDRDPRAHVRNRLLEHGPEPCEGTAITRTSAVATASSSDEVAFNWGASAAPGM